MKRNQLISLLVFLIIIAGIIITLLLVSYFVPSKQERGCNVQGPFTCKEVKVFTQEQLDQQNYVLLEATDVEELRIIPESISMSTCINAYLDQSSLINSGNKEVKIILECPIGVENETVTGSLEILYMTSKGDVKKAKLIFNVRRVEPLIKRIADDFVGGIVNITKAGSNTGGRGGGGGGGEQPPETIYGLDPDNPLIIAENQSYNIGDLSNTIYFILGDSSILYFNIDNEPHAITFISQEDGSIILNVKSVTAIVTISEEDVQVIDLDSDGILDVAMEISTNKVGDKYISVRNLKDSDIIKKIPIIQIVSPIEGQKFNNASIVVSGTARDGVKLSYVIVKVNGVKVPNPIGLIGKVATWQTQVNLVEGNNVIEAQSFNVFEVGSTVAKINVRFESIIPPTDTKSPTVSITHSPTNPILGDTLTLTATATDESGISQIRIYSDGVLKRTCTSSPCTYSGIPPVGTHTYYADATDTYGNIGRNPLTGTTSFTVTQSDTQNPTVTITYPTGGSLISNSNIVVSGTSNDDTGVTSVRVRLNNAALWLTATGTNPWSIPITLIPGTNTIEAQSFDASGKSSTITKVNVELELGGDETNPTVSVTHSPPSPTTTDNVVITVSASDVDTGDSGIKEIRIYVDGSLSRTCTFITACMTTSCICITSAKTYTTGTHNYYAEVTDGADNINRDPVTGTKSFSVSIAPDTTSPSVSISHSPTNPILGDTLTLTATATDESGISQIRIYSDGVLKRTCTSSPCTYSGIPPVGTHTYYADATDTYGNIGRNPLTGTKSFVVVQGDITPPILSVSHSPTNPLTTDSVTIKVSASDASGIKQIQIYADNILLKTCTSTTTCSYSNIFTFGNHTYYATALDNYDNMGVDPLVGKKSFTVTAKDLTSPTLIVTHSPISPTDKDQVTLNVIASDVITGNSGISEIKIYVDGVVSKTCLFSSACMLSSCTCATSASTYTTGTHTYYATAKDNAVSPNIATDPSTGTKSFSVSSDKGAIRIINHSYPRIGAIQWSGATADWLSRFDVVMQAPDNVNNQNRANAEEIKDLRVKNPDLYILSILDWNIGGPFYDNSGSAPGNLPPEWRLKNSVGSYVLVYGKYYFADITDYCGRYTGIVNGYNVYNETFAEAMARILAETTDWTLWDGVSSSGSWTSTGSSSIDFDRNGVSDTTEYGGAWVQATWWNGQDHARNMLRDYYYQMFGSRNAKLITWWTIGSNMSILTANGVGWENMFWNYPKTFSSWPALITEWQSKGPLPRINYVTGDVAIDAGHAPTRRADYFRLVRWALGITLLHDSYFITADMINHHWSNYYDEFDVPLGWPKGNARQLANGAWIRCFDNGAAIVNPTNAAITVTNSMLQAYPECAGVYYRFWGNQDPTWNNGELFDQVTLISTGPPICITDSGGSCTVTQYIGDGIILVKQPNFVIASDIIIDNTEVATSAGSVMATLTGFGSTYASSSNTNYNPVWDTRLFSHQNHYAAANSGAKATFKPTINVDGQYDIYEWHGGAGSSLTSYTEATNTPITISHADGATPKTIDQRNNYGQWNLIGRYNFSAGGNYDITLITSGANGYVIADAFMWRYVGPLSALACTNECSISGAIQCSGTTGYQTCGNYDADTCLEWSSVTNCLSGQTCSGGTCITPTSGTTYYIDATLGSDSNSGTSPTSAWKTLTKLNNMWGSIKAGDSILLKRGEKFAPTISGKAAIEVPIGQGTSSAYITIGAYGTGALPPVVSVINSPSKAALYISGASYMIFQDIEFHGKMNLESRTSSGIHHLKFLRIILDGQEILPYSQDIDFVSTWAATEVAAEQWTFYDLYNIEIGYSIFRNLNYRSAIHPVVTSGNWWIHHNQIYNVAGCMAFAQGNNVVVEYNICYNAGNGFKFQPQRLTMDNLIFRGNLIYDITGQYDVPLILLNVRNSKIYHNTIYARNTGINGNGVLYGWQPSNPVYFCGIGTWGNQGNLIANNLFAGYLTLNTANNVRLTYKDGTDIRYTHDLTKLTTLNNFKNNLYYSTFDSSRIKAVNHNSGTWVYYGTSCASPGYCDVYDRTYTTIASSSNFYTAWNGRTSAITGEKTGDPLFVNPSANNFHLQSGSPAINAGVTIPEWTQDLDGKSITGTPTIGAYQY